MTKAFEEIEWTDGGGRVWTRGSFFDKMDWEGGVEGLLSWGGPSVFPPSLRGKALIAHELFSLIYSDEWGEDDES